MSLADDGYVDVGPIRDLRPGSGRAYALGSDTVAVFRTDEGWVAIGDTCPHMGTALSDGRCVDGKVECPWHHWRYDVVTGASDARDWARVPVYDVRIEDGRVWLRAPTATGAAGPVADEDASEDEDDAWMRADPETFFKKPRS